MPWRCATATAGATTRHVFRSTGVDHTFPLQALREYAKSKRLTALPSPIEYFGYLLACGNLLAGPFYEYADYRDYIQRRAPYTAPLPAPWVPGVARLAKGLFYMALHTHYATNFAPQLLETSRFFDLGTVQRCACAVGKHSSIACHRAAMVMWIGFIYRTKYYFVWGMAESGLILSGLCYNGRGAQGQPLWDKYINARIRCAHARLCRVKIENSITATWRDAPAQRCLRPIGTWQPGCGCGTVRGSFAKSNTLAHTQTCMSD